MPRKQLKRHRLGWNDGSCVRKRAEYKDYVWSYDFVADRTHDGRPVRMLVIVDEFTRECLAIEVARSLCSEHVLECLGDLFVKRGTPSDIRSDNGSEFTAHAVRGWLDEVGVKTLFIEPGAHRKTDPWSPPTACFEPSC